METKIHTQLNDDLLSDWTALWQQSPHANIFNSPGWYTAYIRAFKPAEQRIITLYKNTGLIGIMPLVKDKLYGINVHVMPGKNYLHRAAVLADLKDNAVSQGLVDAMRKTGTVLLSHLDDDQLQLLESRTDRLSALHVSETLQLPLIKDEAGELKLAKKSQILKKARDEMAQISLKSYRKNLKEGMDLLLAVDSVSTKQKHNYSVFADDTVKAFYRNLTENLQDNIDIFILFNKQTPAAYELGFIDSMTYLDSERAYADDHAYYTPGKVLMVKIAEQLADRNFSCFDLGPGTDNFKKSLTDNGQLYTDVIFAENNLLRNLLVRLHHLRNRVYEFVFANQKLYSGYKRIKNLRKF